MSVADTAALEELASRLRVATRSSRVTIRFHDGELYPVVAESCADGVAPLRDVVIDPRGTATFEFLRLERRLLVQDDVASHALAPPPAIAARYGVRSQMVAPLFDGDELAALISVHDVVRARAWSPAEEDALRDAVAALACLDRP
jgi:GAF domain-containing protein